jgi:hypothetical protein
MSDAFVFRRSHLGQQPAQVPQQTEKESTRLKLKRSVSWLEISWLFNRSIPAENLPKEISEKI